MSDRRDYIALDWVAGEIAESLQLAGNAIQAYIDDTNDSAQLDFCLSYIHQVRGGLGIVEFFALELLALEVEQCIQAVQAGDVADIQQGDALQVLQAAIQVLAHYLETLRETRRDDPARLLLTLNELRAVRGLSLIYLGALFNPAPAPAQAQTVAEGAQLTLPEQEFLDVARKLRQMYQIALLGILRGHEVRKNLDYLAKVCTRVARLSEGSPVGELWSVCIALVEGLLNNSITHGAAVKSLLRRVDAEIRQFVSMGRAVLEQPLPDHLFRDLLFYVATSSSDSRFISGVRQQYQLGRALLEPPQAGDSEAYQQQLRQTLARELGSLVTAVDQGQSSAPERGTDLLVLAAVFGLDREYQVLASLFEGPTAEQDSAAIADQLRELAQRLQAPATDEPRRLFNDSEEAQQHLDRAYTAILRESRNGLELSRDAIVSFVANQWQVDYLQELPELLGSISGSLVMAEMRQAAGILRSCQQFVARELIAEPHVPDWKTLDALADALTSVDYYLERIASDPQRDDEGVLEIATQCVAALGYPLEGYAEPVPEDIYSRPEPVVEVADSPVPLEELADPNPDTDTDTDTETEAIDPEIVEVFIEEAGEVQAVIDEQLPVWRENLGDRDCLTEIRRAFHTLKGSGRMVEAVDIGELGWAVENMLNRVMENHLQMDAPRLALVEAVAQALPALIEAFAQGRRYDPSQLQSWVDMAGVLAKEQSPHIDLPAAVTPDTLAGAQSDSDEDASLVEIFSAEARVHLEAVERFLITAHVPAPLPDPVQRSLHTLKGAANMAQFLDIAAVVTPTEKLVKEMRALQLPADAELLQLLREVLRAVQEAIEQIDAGEAGVISDKQALLDRISSYTDFILRQAAAGEERASAAGGSEEVSRFLIAASEHLGGVQQQVSQAVVLTRALLQHLGGSVAVVSDRAEQFGFDAIAELAHELRNVMQRCEDPVPAGLADLISSAVDHMMEQFNQVAAEQKPQADTALLEQLQNFDSLGTDTAPISVEQEVEQQKVEPELERQVEQQQVDPEPPPPGDVEPATLEPVTAAPAAPVNAPAASLPEEDIDPEILSIFLEEAEDLLEGIDESIHQWSVARELEAPLDNLQRHLHTLKGGARLAGLMRLGELAHQFEAYIVDCQQQNTPRDEAFLATMLNFHDRLVAGVAVAAGGSDIGEIVRKDIEEIIETDAAPAAESTAAAIVPEGTRSKPPQLLAETDTREAVLASMESYAPQEMVKVSAQLMESLVNLAGETSIARGRAEEQINDFTFSLEEMLSTVERLQEQVRRLDLETEAQILFRQEQVESEGQDGFDPLEFDRYSQLQQLSRSLLESASDLIDLRNTLADRSRDMETLLLQQGRINTELQEGLMRSRMVHFSRMVPRLRRIVRQISLELGKHVDFKVYNAEGELDRQVLERIVPPLEHMLRNAVDHGIEDEQERLAVDKPAQGSISMRFDREGSDVLITLWDDGRGIDFDAVRRKAEELGMVKPGQEVTEGMLAGFLFHAGFSTAKHVTQISGRGVGMDVVYSEIKQLGGSVKLESTRGQGTRFIIRLPFTVSVNRALMVSVGGDIFAVPINAIEGIVRVSPYELEVYYQPDPPPFEYAGQSYSLRYMGAMLNTQPIPHLDGQVEPRPVLLVRGGERATAIQVDNLMGSREVVVKALGPQFGFVQALSGATVLGDGSVVVILDLLAMVRRDMALIDETLLEESPRQIENSNPLVMVVDDSVTVRKVTGRLLERQGMDVVTARDGVDAVTQLGEMERLPDVILLDIEMPRMDGFEVASRVRHTPRLQHIPIVMITSRTGDKHRERAFSLGVNKYLGKPYQETALLQAIREVTTEAA